MANEPESLNPNHLRRLRTTCEYIDKLLSSMEGILRASESKAAFPKYISDISPAQRRVIEDYIARIRSRLLHTLESQGVPPEPPSIPASRALHSDLTFVDIAVEELRPRYMRGYGEVPPKAAAELNGIVGELQGLVARLDEYVNQAGRQDLQKRLERLAAEGADLSALQTLERIIDRRGLVEFRASLSVILDRLEDKTFEIAIFGRVSSGKSSLLNAILESDLLPVGVTPITSVPTRLMFGNQRVVQVWYADSRPSEVVEIERLAEFVTEQHNPENRKHVSRIVVQLPSPALRDGIVFVDTPGLGSLAKSGTAETMAYLPKCDLGVVLIDASSPLSPDDLHTIQALYEAAIPASVLLSKSDLLSEADRARTVEYTKRHIHSELGLDIHVYPVSVVATHRQFLTDWFEHEIAPLYGRRQELKMQSLQRKIALLRQSVGSALRMRLARAGRVFSKTQMEVGTLDAELRAANARIEEAAALVNRIAEGVAKEASDAIHAAAAAVIASWSNGKFGQEKELISTSLLGATQKYAAELQQALHSLAEGLSSALAETARSLGVSDAPGLEEFTAFMREMPAFDPAPFTKSVSRPALARAFGRSAEQRAVQHRIEEEIGAQLQNALDAYSALLRAWGESVIARMRHLFETYADAYRAQLERQSPTSKERGPDSSEKLAILEELQALGLAEQEDVLAPRAV